jgi:carbon monoxide dehydrogenase subunit G
MPTTRRSRTLAAPLERVWELVDDPHSLPRWWPGVSRMEGVVDDRFTEVHMTRKGRGIRVDFRLLESVAPEGAAAGHRVWEQDVIGTPFERVLRAAITDIAVEATEGGTRVSIAVSQKLRGSSRFGAFMLRRATRARLDEALDNIGRLV